MSNPYVVVRTRGVHFEKINDKDQPLSLLQHYFHLNYNLVYNIIVSYFVSYSRSFHH